MMNFRAVIAKEYPDYAERLAHELDLDEKTIMDVKPAAIFHDAGLMGIPLADLKDIVYAEFILF